MKPPKLFGKIIYFCGYPIFRLLIKNSTRAYVIVQVGNEVLLTQNWLGFQKKWRLPGGGVQAGEQPMFAAQRELKEEVGISVHEQNFIAVSKKPFKSSINYDYYLFELKLPEKPELTVADNEILSAEFIAIDKLKTMNLSEEIRKYLELANKT